MQEPTHSIAGSRALTVLVAGASTIVLIVGLQYFAGIIGPLFLALVLTIAVQPLREAVIRRGVPRWVGSVVAMICLFAGLLALSFAIVAAGAQLVNLLGDFGPQFGNLRDQLADTMRLAGMDASRAKDVLSSFDFGKLSGFIATLLAGAAGLASNVVLILGLLLFMTLDAAGYSGVLRRMPTDRQPLADALGKFAKATRRYLVVSTVFGAIVALLDVGVLYLLNVPAPWLWGLLAFITNYIPNIGFVIGLIPPALLALLSGGWESMLLVIALYVVINAVIQSGLQPKIVGGSVGLSGTLSFLSLIFWAFVLGAWGALLAIPLTLFARALLVDVDAKSRWVLPLLSGQPDEELKESEDNQANAQGPTELDPSLQHEQSAANRDIPIE
ncbi:MAG: AI-2E family transporter [Propionibacteriaceae bacterium]|jgi:AI-2 transport protein TqsA